MQQKRTDLLELSLELTVYGIFLAIIIPMTSHRLNTSSVATICCFLACVFLFRVVSPVKLVVRYFWGRTLSVVCCVFFAWWLLYQAENTRIGWYRFHILQERVQKLISKAPAYIIISDEMGVITGASDNINLLIGWKKEDIIGKNIHMFMRDGPLARHDIAFKSAVEILKAEEPSPNAGWMMQGIITGGIKHKNGNIVPVRAYAGGIRWSQDMQFQGDIDMFAVFVPVSEKKAREEPSTIPNDTPIQIAPTPPSISPLVPSEKIRP